MIRIRSKQGFALPMALMVMVVLTAGITAGYAATSSEIVSNAAHRGDTRAYNLAVAGLEQFLARRSEVGFCSNCLADPTAAVADSEWTTVQLSGGYAIVKSVRVRKHINDTMPALFFVRSMGVDQSAKISVRRAP
jgi:Tfp pilus assembly protein PilV